MTRAEWGYTAEDVRVRIRIARANLLTTRLSSAVTFVGLSPLAYRYRHKVVARAASLAQRRLAAGGLRQWKWLGGGVSLLYGPLAGVAVVCSMHVADRLSWSLCRRKNERFVQLLHSVHSAFRRVHSAPLYYPGAGGEWSQPSRMRRRCNKQQAGRPLTPGLYIFYWTACWLLLLAAPNSGS